MRAKQPSAETDQLALIHAARSRGWDPDRVMRAMRLSRATYFRRVKKLDELARGKVTHATTW